MSIVIQSDLQGYNSSSINTAVAQNIFEIALSQGMSHRMKCLFIATAQLCLDYFFICPHSLSSDFIQPNSIFLPPILSSKAKEFHACSGKVLSVI